MMLTAFGEELLSFFMEIFKAASAFGVAYIIYVIYLFKTKKIIISRQRICFDVRKGFVKTALLFESYAGSACCPDKGAVLAFGLCKCMQADPDKRNC